MAPSDDLINFNLIEEQKENIQSLPGGRSARKLAELYSPAPLHKLSSPTPSDTNNVNDCIRTEYEAEIQNISESDDPLDVFDRYVRWTLDAYPSAQATPQSKLHILLERATKTFINSTQYRNDPRYLRLWVHYIHLFSDAPRETYMFLSRHGIGDGLALFYEEYAEWLEGAARWAQAEEVYKLGIEREARPVQRLVRKFKEFEERLSQQSNAETSPSSPALPTVRPALACKIDPFDVSSRPGDPQAQNLGGGCSARPPTSKAGKPKLAIFFDNDAKAPALSSKPLGSEGWDTIGSLSDRKKENVVSPKQWAGETLSTGGKKIAVGKMSVFRDPFLFQVNNVMVVPSKSQVTVHPHTGKRERIFVRLSAVYPTPEIHGTELSFDEIIAAERGWLDQDWESQGQAVNHILEPIIPFRDVDDISSRVAQKLVIHKEESPLLFDENGIVRGQPRVSSKAGRKKKMMEVNETQVIKAKLDSPSGSKSRKKHVSEPTMTLHTRAATDDIYDIFNAPLKRTSQQEGESEDDDEYAYETDGDYTTDAESIGTTKRIDTNEQDEDNRSVSGVGKWPDSASREHAPCVASDEFELSYDRASVAVSETHSQQDIPDDSLSEDLEPRTRTIFIPMPPEDYEPPTRPFRDAAEVANNRLPFMTPITERTESSLDVEMERVEQHKTPCKYVGVSHMVDDMSGSEPFSSPIRGITIEELPMPETPPSLDPKSVINQAKASSKTHTTVQGPIIKDNQCNPVEEDLRQEILSNIKPPLLAYEGFNDHRFEKYPRGGELRKFVRGVSKAGKGNSADKSGVQPVLLTIDFPNSTSHYSLGRELGSGAYAHVHLVENLDLDREAEGEKPVATIGKGAPAVGHRARFEALKMETPPSAWEFYMMRVVHSRLGSQHRAAASISYAHEIHLYEDEAFLFLTYHPHGTLLDVVNLFRAEPSGVMDEQLAMFFTVELLRTVEALHARSILHGDLKADNCLLRLDPVASEQPLTSPWRSDGSSGWWSRGIVLVDFGRGIDMKSFVSGVEFIADWKSSAQDCAEIREGRPWTWQIDYHGLAGIIHCLLFGKYIETCRCDQGGLGRNGRRYKIRESFKRYWQTDLWGDCFDVLLNPTSHLDREDGATMPVLKSMRMVRERMEACLAASSEKGIGLRSLMGKVEAFAKSRR